MSAGRPGEFAYVGLYRAKVVEVDLKIEEDKNDYGAIRVFVPDLMTDIDKDFDDNETGIIAYPAFPFGGGYNKDDEDSHFQSCVVVPLKGSFVWVFFEGGSPSKPFYMGAYHFKNSMMPPEVRDGKEPHKVALLYKSKEGRAIVISDDEENCRVEITGKKRKLKEGPEGNKDSVYKTKDNQTVILLDERNGKEKLLIKTHKDDFINIDIEKQELHIKFKGDIVLNTEKSLHLKTGKDIIFQAGGNINLTAGKGASLSGGTSATINGLRTTIKASTIVAIDGVLTSVQGGIGNCTGGGGGGSPREAKGDRDGSSGGIMGGGLGGNLLSGLGGDRSSIFQDFLANDNLASHYMSTRSSGKPIDSFTTDNNMTEFSSSTEITAF